MGEGRVDQLPGLASELVALGRRDLARASSRASGEGCYSTVPVVFTIWCRPRQIGAGGETLIGPVVIYRLHFVDTTSGSSKRLGLLREIIPNAIIHAVLLDPTWPSSTPN